MITIEKLCGHIIKWTKGHYPGKSFDEVVTAYTGWTGRHGRVDRCAIMFEGLLDSGQLKPHLAREFIQSIFFHAAIEAQRPTSYHMRDDDKVTLGVLEKTLLSQLMSLAVLDHKGEQILILPKTMDKERFETYRPELA